MASLYEQLMASKGAPKAAAATNSTQIRKAPMSLRSAMRKYAEGGDVTNAAPDYSPGEGGRGIYEEPPRLDPRNEPMPYIPGEGGRGIPTPYPVPEYARNIEKRRSEQEQENPRVSEDYYFKMRNLLNPPPEEPRYDPMPYIPGEGGRGIPTPYPPPEDPGFYQPPVDGLPEPRYKDIMPVLPPVYDDLTPVPPPEVYPQYPTDPGFYQRPVDYYNPSPPMDFTQDPGFYQPPVDFSPTPKRSDDLKKLIEDIISNKGTGNLLENQRKLMALLEMLKGK